MEIKKCSECGGKLSSYNQTGKCFRHNKPSAASTGAAAKSGGYCPEKTVRSWPAPCKLVLNMPDVELVLDKIFNGLPERSRDILKKRFGFRENPECQTLDEIGSQYGIVKERVRQIEEQALRQIRKDPSFDNLRETFEGLEKYFEAEGGALTEEMVLDELELKEIKDKNLLSFLFSLRDSLSDHDANNKMLACWTYGEKTYEKIVRVLDEAVQKLHAVGHAVNEDDFFKTLSLASKNIFLCEVPRWVLERWAGLSKLFVKNFLGKWGLVESREARPRSAADYSYLILSQCAKPLHFSEIAKKITHITENEINARNVHNQLMTDPRFVNVGFGIYALSEWGYKTGDTKDVMVQILQETGPLSKEELILRTLKKKIIQAHTIKGYLSDKKRFRRLEDGRYSAVQPGENNG